MNRIPDNPESVKVQLIWRDAHGKPSVLTEIITADEFFGRGSHGAPMDGTRIISTIDRMRRAGPPKNIRRGKR